MHVQFSNDSTTLCLHIYKLQHSKVFVLLLAMIIFTPFDFMILAFKESVCFVFLILFKSCNSPTDVAFVLSHAKVSLHVVPGVSQLSSCKVADLTHEGFGSCKRRHGEFISNHNIMFERKKWQF